MTISFPRIRNDRVHSVPTYVLVLGTAIATILCQKIIRGITSTEENSRERMAKWLLKIPCIRAKYEQKLHQEYIKFCERTRESLKIFGTPITSIPEEGWTKQQIFDLLKSYKELTNTPLADKQLSGTVYQPSLSPCVNEKISENSQNISFSFNNLQESSKQMQKLFLLGSSYAGLWNPLHADEFPIGTLLEYQVTRMVAEMFGAEPEEVTGIVTSGGSESLMHAMHAYRNWGMRVKNIPKGQTVIIGSQSAHAAFIKGAEAYDIKLVLVPTDQDGKMNLKDVEREIRRYGNRVVALIGSAPSYPLGQIDHIQALAQLAEKNGVGMHVDSCLGGFIVNHLDEYKMEYLKLKGVTSLSADTHKNGLGLKGSSTLLMKDMPKGHNLAFYGCYSIPFWQGGLYGSPSDPGSRSCQPALIALVSMLFVGKKGYQQIALAIQSAVKKIKTQLEARFKNRIQVLGESNINVVAFKVHEDLNLGFGATYALAAELAEKGFVANTIAGDCLHFCFTARFISDSSNTNRLLNAIEECLEIVKRQKANGEAFSGDAPLYGQIERTIKPVPKRDGIVESAINYFLGRTALEDAVRLYFMAKLNPYKKQE